jgi:hypothetical protein
VAFARVDPLILPQPSPPTWTQRNEASRKLASEFEASGWFSQPFRTHAFNRHNNGMHVANNHRARTWRHAFAEKRICIYDAIEIKGGIE